MFEVRKVANKADFKAFFEYPYQLYKDYPKYVPELPSLRRETLNKEKHAAWEYLTGEYFVAWRDGACVGTIAAVVNHRHNEFHEENVGFFGFFECIDDQAVADALLKAAEDYLQGHGVNAIRGPASFSSNEVFGMQIDSFDRIPMVLMPYNPPYYPKLVENYGYAKAMRLDSWELSIQDAIPYIYEADGVTETKLIRTVRKNFTRRKITARYINTKDKKREFTILKNIYNAAWEKNWGFVPMTERELDELESNLGILLMPEYTVLAFVDDQPAGFLLCIPNLNEVIAHVMPHPGVPEIWWLLKTLWHFKIRPKATSLRGILMGVKEEFRGLGVESALFLWAAESLAKDKRHQSIEASWILETNLPTIALLKHFNFQSNRHHMVYEKKVVKNT